MRGNMANVGQVVNGVLQDANNAITTTDKDRKGTSELGKDAFLQLLVCQMKNQDPLNPQNDTEFVAQLATFSQLEQLQNLNATYEKSQAFSLIGKDVILNVEDETGREKQITGKVQYVNASGGSVKLYVGGELYDIEDLYAVLDESYVEKVCLPGVTESYKFTYDAKEPGMFQVNLFMGEGDYQAKEVALVINNKVVPKDHYKLDGNRLTIFGEAFKELPNGSYAVAVVFNDDDYTTVEDKIAVTVVNSEVPPAEEDDKEGDKDETDQKPEDEVKPKA